MEAVERTGCRAWRKRGGDGGASKDKKRGGVDEATLRRKGEIAWLREKESRILPIHRVLYEVMQHKILGTQNTINNVAQHSISFSATLL